jgi:hypothetical protein
LKEDNLLRILQNEDDAFVSRLGMSSLFFSLQKMGRVGVEYTASDYPRLFRWLQRSLLSYHAARPR